MKVNRCTSGKRGSERDLHLIVFCGILLHDRTAQAAEGLQG